MTYSLLHFAPVGKAPTPIPTVDDSLRKNRFKLFSFNQKWKEFVLDPLFHSCVTEEYFSDEKEETITNGNDNLISIF